ncbi:MAG: matrixin family metalloprotease [Acidobacteria bacterium]|nr:matrixin family metalloprotease [Acidobacteriota bacterium]
MRREVVFAARHCEGLEWGSTVAIAQYWYRGGQVVDADVAFDAARSWDVYYGRRGFAIDFRRVAMHEFGHVLGLDHPDDHGQVRTAIMNSSVSDTDRLQSDDISGIRGIYGSDRPRGGAPDLVVQALRTSPGTLTAGQTFTLSATVRNAGSGTAAATTLRYYYYYRSSSKEWVVVGTDPVGSLSGSASSAESIRLTAPSGAGTHCYNACVASVAGETDRENCSGNLRVTVTAGGGGAPDLEVESLRTSPGTLTVGGTFTLSATVRNAGSGTAAATLRYYYYDSDTEDWAVVGTDSVGSLLAAAISAESIRLTAPSDAGTHYYNACAASVAGETRRENCAGSLRVTVTAGGGGAPDLEVESLRTSPGTLTVGETFTLSATVRNVGMGTAAAATLRYHYYRSSSKEWVVVGQDGVGSLTRRGRAAPSRFA